MRACDHGGRIARGFLAECRRNGDSGVQNPVLFPFYFARGAVAEAAGILLKDNLGGGLFWKESLGGDTYKDEFLKHVVRYLFPETSALSASESSRDCVYLRASDVTLKQWFKSSEVELPKTGSPKDLVQGREAKPPPIHGGLFDFTSGGPAFHYARRFRDIHAAKNTSRNFRSAKSLGGKQGAANRCSLAYAKQCAGFQLSVVAASPQAVKTIDKPHPGDDPDWLAQVPQEKRPQLPPKLPEAAPLEERLTSPYGRFTLAELLQRLILTPLQCPHGGAGRAAGNGSLHRGSSRRD